MTQQNHLTDQYASVIVDCPLGVLDYRVGEDMTVAVGDRVVVPLGNRKLVGIVVSVKAATTIEKKIRCIQKVLSETRPLNDEWLGFTHFAANYYIRSWGESALSALPRYFRTVPGVRREASLKRIREAKVKTVAAQPRPELNEEQRLAVETITNGKGYRPYVLFGVTGSGKTEVYLRVMEQTLQSDSEAQVLLLVPEINLTPQLEQRVRERFEGEYVTTLHSALTQTERAKHWLAVHEGRSRVLVGTRLAVFASFKNLKLIIVDEEHDASYKADDGLRFSARDLALKRAQSNAIACVLGSATPSLETWAKVRAKTATMIELKHRAKEASKLPGIEVVEAVRGNSAGFSPRTQQAIDEALKAHRQVLVFINRRGYAPTMTCGACGWVSRCAHCSGFTVYHKQEQVLVCHHCGTKYPLPRACPVCGNQDIEVLGAGTQRIEEAIASCWSQARVLRIDRDSAADKESAQKAFESVHHGEADIVIGTQMIAKGHDFQNVGLVVAMHVDALLMSSNLHAQEQLFATLMQVAGRAGRSEAPGNVIVQTRFTRHPLFQALVKHDYTAFADRLLQERQEELAPPFACQALILTKSRTLEMCLQALSEVAREAEALAADGQVRVYDPVPMTLMRLMDEERAQLLVEAESRGALNRFLWQLCERIRIPSSVAWTIEVDPDSI